MGANDGPAHCDADVHDYAATVTQGVRAGQPQIDELLMAHLRGWSLARLGVLERAILRVATYELNSQPSVPVAVIVDQAVELAKRYCSAEAGSLVNGILSGVAAAARPAECTTEPIAQSEQP